MVPMMTALSTASERLTPINPAQAVGAVWGQSDCTRACVPEGRALLVSIFEKILLADSNTAFCKQRPVFLCKRNPFVVFFLSFDIVHYLFFVVDAIRECGVFMSPSSEIRKQRVCLEPFTGECLHVLHVLCQRNGCRERYKDMHMVRHTANTVYFSMQVVGLLHDDSIKFSVVFDGNSGFAAIGAENNMVKGLDITHGMITSRRAVYCIYNESASLRDAYDWTYRFRPHTALRLCGVIESQCLQHMTCHKTRGLMRCCIRNTDWTTKRLLLSRA